MIADEKDAGTNICSAWADASDAVHPADPNLRWQFWEPSKNTFMHDPMTGVATAPESVTVLGRREENTRINGTYDLVGVNSGRPVYASAGTGMIIRSSQNCDRWLIVCEEDRKGWLGQIMGRAIQYLVNGDQNNANDECVAWASAKGTEHPGHIFCEWHVWENLSGLHVNDASVACTSSPMVLRVSGRDAARPGFDINGDYTFAFCVNHRAAYRKQDTMEGTPHFLYWSKQGRWVFDRNGMGDTGVVAAYVEGDSCSDHPAGLQHWNFHESQKGSFVSDPAVLVSVPLERPAALPTPAMPLAFDDADRGLHPSNLACRGTKRGYCLDSGVAPFAHPCRNLNLDFDRCQQKFARTAEHGGPGWRGVFGA